jgi:hypothetical protein
MEWKERDKNDFIHYITYSKKEFFSLYLYKKGWMKLRLIIDGEIVSQTIIRCKSLDDAFTKAELKISKIVSKYIQEISEEQSRLASLKRKICQHFDLK